MISAFRSLTARHALLLLGLASAGALAAALVAQYGFHLHPCELCVWQRWPYAGVIALALIGAVKKETRPLHRTLLLAAASLLLADAGIAAYHAGVEQGIFKGLSGCSAPSGEGLTIEEMRAQILNAPLVPCNQPMADFFGLSMAAWNAMFALALAAFALVAWRKVRRA
jgi:disulfide bond formation protein DsbB